MDGKLSIPILGSYPPAIKHAWLRNPDFRKGKHVFLGRENDAPIPFMAMSK
jgi:hypothetical protein